jgi:hypothetical protein
MRSLGSHVILGNMDELEQILSRATRAHTELHSFVEVALQGLGWAENARRIHDLMVNGEAPLSSNPAISEFHRHRAEQAEAFALAQGPLGFPYLWYLASVRLWTILEVAVDDIVLEMLQHPDLLPTDSVLEKLEGPLLSFLQGTAEDRADHLLTLLKEKLRASFRPGVGRLEVLLEPVGLGGPCHEKVRRTLLELSQVRHLVVHKNGLVDRRFRNACPWLELQVGQPLPLGHSNFVSYGLSVDWYDVELGNRIERCFGRTPRTDAVELQRDLQSKLSEALEPRPSPI